MKNHKKKNKTKQKGKWNEWRWWKTEENFYYHFVLRENINFHCSDLLYSRWLQPLSNIHVIIRLSERNTSAIVFMKSTLLEFSMILKGWGKLLAANKMMLWKLWLLKQRTFFVHLKIVCEKSLAPSVQTFNKQINFIIYSNSFPNKNAFHSNIHWNTNANPCSNEQFMLALSLKLNINMIVQ